MEKMIFMFWFQFEELSKNSKENSNVLFTKHDHECMAGLFLNSTKSKWSLQIMRFVMISCYHTGDCGKNWGGSSKVDTYVAYKSKNL